ncbi:glycoprotein-N-acetylgalactosamine 3-beta-galactosyltransferase 1, partial [Galendromus occidentalis]|uniref:N-acetylgalactosaminide beta-1,3-galactosyltransferase n=1 Tax=Galendromus occidentalis TaxID=34638 RepID=A0AAJ7SEP3_9ACAR
MTGIFTGFFIGLVVISLVSNARRNGTILLPGSSRNFEQWLNLENLRILAKPSSSSVPIAQYLYDRVQISCVVLSSKQRQARAVIGTWGRHCNSLSFVADFEDKYVPVDLKASLQDPHILCLTLHKFAEKRFVADKNQWLLLADDMTFAVVENLRYLVAPLNTSENYYLGHAVTRRTLRGSELIVNVLSGGIVLSQGAVLALLLALSPDCNERKEEEHFDVTIAQLLMGTDATLLDTRDSSGSTRFLARPVEKLLIEKSVSPYDKFVEESIFAPKLGKRCCSANAITFHGVDALDMHFFEYLVNRVQIGKSSNSSPPLRSEDIPPVILE